MVPPSGAVAAPSPPKGPWAGKRLHVWITACDVESREVADIARFAASYPKVLGGVGVACTVTTREGGLEAQGEHPVGLGRASVARRIAKLGLPTSLVISNVGPNGFDGPLALAALSKPATRARLADNVVNVARQEGFASVELDFEMMPTAASANYVKLTEEIVVRLRGDGGSTELSIDLHPKTVDDPGWAGPGAHDYAALAKTGAVLRLMTYDLSIGPVPAGPSTKASWVRDVVAYARSKGVPPEQLEIGLPAYGYDFPPPGNGPAVPMRFEEVNALRVRVNATVTRDGADVPHFTYEGPDGLHEVWYDDGKSIGRLLREISDLAPYVRGVAVWGIGRSDPDLGKLLAEQGFQVAAGPARW